MSRTITHFFSSISILSPRIRQTSRIFTNTGIRLSSSLSTTAPYLIGSRIFYPSLNSFSNSKVDCDWTPPLRVSCIWNYIESYWHRHDCYFGEEVGSYPRLVLMNLDGVHFDSEKELYEYYIKLVGYALGSEEEAKRRIYLVSLGCCHAFGAKLDFDALMKLSGLDCVCSVLGDLDHLERNNDLCDEPDAHFSPMNLNFRLNNIFSYYHLSERNSKWNSDHWLVSIKLNCVPTEDEDEIDELFVKLLTEVVGSKMKAAKKIYAVWYTSPIGFGAEIDEEDAKKLQGMEDVFKVYPDYAFDVKGRCLTNGLALHVMTSSYDLTFSSFHSHEGTESKDCLVSGDSSGSHLMRQNSPFSPISQRHPYNDIFSYHHMNGVESHWRADRWLFRIKQPRYEHSNEQHIIISFIRILAEVVGSETDAKSKIYIIWCKTPFGFGAEVDEETANKLKGLPDVLLVLPDYGFDVNKRNSGDVLYRAEDYKRRFRM